MKTIEEIKATPNILIKKEGQDGIGGSYYERYSDKWLNFIFSWGAGFEHLSVSTPRKTPTWQQMCVMKDIFWNEDEICMQLHPAKKEYVNNHPYCLHIWKPIDKEIPTPPSIMVGLKDNYSIEDLQEILSIYDDLPKW